MSILRCSCSDGNARRCGKNRNRHAKTASARENANKQAENFIPLIVPEVHRPLWWLVWERVPGQGHVTGNRYVLVVQAEGKGYS
jgi:hypothetical protein